MDWLQQDHLEAHIILYQQQEWQAGGAFPKPGEVSLAHNGVLFLDELPEFKHSSLEVLRGPMEDRKVTISRVQANLTYPCNFMLVASMNPCPCRLFWW